MTLALSAGLGASLHGPALSDGLWLQGMFCNTEAQIDGVLAHVGEGWTPRTAVAIVNDGGAVCTYVDLLHYVVERPVTVGGYEPVLKYRGMLTGVVVGGRLREVAPPAEVFFVTPGRIAEAAVERRT